MERLEKEIQLKEELPHLFSRKWYAWALSFFECRNSHAFISAANQISKSSTLIRLCIEWATNKALWKELWPGETPNQFWYFYPDYDTATAEYKTKWQEFLPRGSMRNSFQYGWKPKLARDQIDYIQFQSGVIVYFRAYSQKLANIQAGTVYAVFLDEEPPEEVMPELELRISAVNGYMRGGFTPTLGQDYWRRVMEPSSPDEELYKEAFKQSVSMYDCLKYADGSPSPWTYEKIKRIEARCATKAEILRRVYGRFVNSVGLKFESFDRERDTLEPHHLPPTWNIYGGVDYGTGGVRGHPAALLFIGVSPDFKRGRVFKAWRGDFIPTTSADILKKYRELRGGMKLTQQVYDHAAKEFFLVASQLGEAFSPADKDQEQGTALVNTLFKNEMLKIYRGDPELDKLSVELSTLLSSTPKTRAKDDLCDALRYTVMSIPWDLTAIDEYAALQALSEKDLTAPPIEVPRETEAERIDRERRFGWKQNVDSFDEEVSAWNELYDT